MKPAWRLWLTPCLVGITLLAAVALISTEGRVQADISGRVAAQLANDGQAWASGDVSGRTVTVMGTAPTLIAQRLALESAQRVWGVANVIDGSGIIPLQTPYRWSAVLSSEAVTLSGFVPSDEVRLAVVAAATREFGALPVHDQMQLARGQPVSFLVLTEFALQRLADLAEGAVTLVGPALSIDGTAADDPKFAALAKALSAELPGGLDMRKVRVLPPRRADFAWSARYDGAAITIDGFVPSDGARRDIAAALAAVLPNARIDDNAILASGAPEGFVSAIAFAGAQLGHLLQGRIAIDQGVLSIEGKSKTVADYETALAEIGARRSRRDAGVTIGSVDVLPAHVDPYVWRADRSGNTIVLTGYVPSEQAHRDVVAATAKLMSDLVVTDRIRVADGDPKMDWIGAIQYALEQIALLSKGSVSLTGRNYDITGEALSATAYGTLTDALKKNLPASMALRQVSISPAAISPFTLEAARVPDGVALTGYVPTEEVAKAIVDAARPKFPNDQLQVRLVLAGGAPENLADAVSVGLQAISRLAGGRLDVLDSKVSISGIAVSEEARHAIEDDMRAGLPKNFELIPAMTVAIAGEPLTGPDCQTALRAETERDKVQFDSSGSRVSPDSAGLIDRIAAIVQRCPAATIEIAGHMDSAGGTKKNQSASEDRANAVVDRLVADGVRRERLNAVGYGGTRPIASNSTAAGRAQNRRIEFNVVGQ